MLNKKPVRSLTQRQLPPTSGMASKTHGQNNADIIWGSESNSNFIDVISVAPIGGIKEVFLDETPLSSGEFPKSVVYAHDGKGDSKPWDGNFPYVERTISVGKNAEITSTVEGAFSKTSFTRKVSGKGVQGIRVNFTAGQFSHNDNKNRRKYAQAYFTVTLVDPQGHDVHTVSTSSYRDPNKFSALNPVAIQALLMLPSLNQSYLNDNWEFRVDMFVMGLNYRTSASGNWSASTITELYSDTQTYDKIAYASGNIVARDVSGRIPKRQYLADGYQVLVPKFSNIGGRDVFTGKFDTRTSNSHAWNTIAVLTNTVWGAGLPFDRINITSFLDFHRYTKEQIDGQDRYSFSQYLIKADNYFKLASQMVGSADGKLYEDTSGRIGVMVERKNDKRRVITSYDVLGESVRRISVPENRKINLVQAEFEDKDNGYKKTIIDEQDGNAITKHGLIKKSLKLESCTNFKEATRSIKRVLATSQVAVTTYSFKVGNTHEDIQIGEIVELYDRVYSNMDYCGKIGIGSTTSVLSVDPRTPIDITDMKKPVIVFDNNRGIPTTAVISSWTKESITLSSPLQKLPEEFTSFGIFENSRKGDGADGLKPTLLKVVGSKDIDGIISVEGVEYNHSLYDHVDLGTALVIPKTRYIPESTKVSISGLNLKKVTGSLVADWISIGAEYSYGFNWMHTDGAGRITYLESGITQDLTKVFSPPLTEGIYTFQIMASKDGFAVSDYQVATLRVSLRSGASTLPRAKGLGVIGSDGNLSTEFAGRGFTAMWEQDHAAGTPSIDGYLLTVTQGGKSLEKRIKGDLKQIRITEGDLTKAFGRYGRVFSLKLETIDVNLDTNQAITVSISNPAPAAPTIVIENGTVSLKTSALPEDVSGSIIYVWRKVNTTTPLIDIPVPSHALIVESLDPEEIALPDGYIQPNNLLYVFRAAFVDRFGKDGLNFGVAQKSFITTQEAPVAPELTEAVPLTSSSLLVKFTHDGRYLDKLKGFYRQDGQEVWTEIGFEYTLPVPQTPPVEESSGYDLAKQEGFFKISGLDKNFVYDIRAKVANVASGYSEYSNIIKGQPYLDIIQDFDFDEEIADVRDLIAEGVSDVFGTLGDTLNNIRDAKETDKLKKNVVDLVTEDAKITTALLAVTSDTQAQATSIVKMQAEIGTNKADNNRLSQAIATETSARSRDVIGLRASVGNNVSEIVKVRDALTTETSARVSEATAIKTSVGKNVTEILAANQAISNESSARAAQFLTLTAKTDGNEALIQTANQAIATEKSARVTQFNQISAATGSNSSSISHNSQAISNESSARASQYNSLSARVDSNSSTIATVDSNAKAAIGYCNISGTPSSHPTKAACIGAGGTWVNAPLATAVKNVQVSSGGSTATVGSFYSAYKTLSGQLVGKAVLGVDVSGTFTGMQVLGGAAKSTLIFKGNKIKFQNTSGIDQLVYNSSTNKWEFKGDLSAAAGTFSGLISGGSINIDNRFKVNALGYLTANGMIFGSSGQYGSVDRVIFVNKTGHTSSSCIDVVGTQTANSSAVNVSTVGTGGRGIYVNSTFGDGIISSAGTAADPKRAFYAERGTYAPFTGSHEGLVKNEYEAIEQGDIVCDVKIVSYSDISNAMCEMELSKTPNLSSVRGVYVGISDIDPNHMPVGLGDSEDTGFIALTHKLILFNALGEGMMNVCGEGGNLEIGDLIVSSSMKGKGMKQEDDIYRSRTVAESRQRVTFDHPNQVKQIAVIYKCG